MRLGLRYPIYLLLMRLQDYLPSKFSVIQVMSVTTLTNVRDASDIVTTFAHFLDGPKSWILSQMTFSLCVMGSECTTRNVSEPFKSEPRHFDCLL